MEETTGSGPGRDIYQKLERPPRHASGHRRGESSARGGRRHSGADAPHWLTGRRWFRWWKVCLALLILIGLPVLAFVSFRLREAYAPGEQRARADEEARRAVASTGAAVPGETSPAAPDAPVALDDRARAESYATLAFEYMGRGDLSRAAGYLQTALDRMPGRVEWWGLLGQVLFRQGRYEDAARAFQQAVDRAPQASENYANLVRAYELTADPARALQYVERLRALGGELDEVVLSEGTILSKLGRQDEARRALEEYVAKFPNDPIGLSNLGTVLVILGETDSAFLVLQRAVEADPTLPAPYFNLGVTFARRGDVERAVAWLERAKAHVEQATLQEWVEDVEFDPIREDIVFLRFIDSIGLRDPALPLPAPGGETGSDGPGTA